MATFKKTAKRATKKSAPRRKPACDAAKGEALSKSISESAQQIWLAGVGAFGRAQAEGSRLFEGLMKEGAGLEKTARELASTRAGTMRSAVETGVGQTRERAADTWDRLEKVFEDRVQRALVKRVLSARVDALTEALQRRGARPAAKKTAAQRAPAKKAATKKSAAPRKAANGAKPPARKRAAKKAAPAA